MNKIKQKTLAFTVAGLLFSTGLFAESAKDILKKAGIAGGLVVHLGCEDGKLTTALRHNDSFVVQGIAKDATSLTAARQTIQAAGLYGKVSVIPLNGAQLPYVDNLVNLLVVCDDLGITEDEMMRVLAPGGHLADCRRGDASVTKKERPAGMDEWPQYLHGPDNNPVSRDTIIAPPIRQLQWTGGPDYSRLHETASSVQAMVSSGGRVFTIIDEGSTFSMNWPSKWRLVARDAFNGVVLWKKPMEEWVERYGHKSGPVSVPRRLIADGDNVYVTPGLSAPVTRLDARTGEVRATLEGTEQTEEMVLDGSILYAQQTTDKPLATASFEGKKKGWKAAPRNLIAIDTRTAQPLWRKTFSWIAPLSLTVGEETIYIFDGSHVIALNKSDGSEKWRSETLPHRLFMPTYFGVRMTAVPGGLLYVGGENWIEHVGSKGKMLLLNENDGSIRWQADHMPSGYQSPEDLFVIGDEVWNSHLNMVNTGTLKGKAGSLDLQATGEFFSNKLSDGSPGAVIPGDDIMGEWFHHHRCHPARATIHYFITSRTGIELLNIKTGEWHLNNWIRGSCLYGLMPANGLIYAPQHPCACFAEAKLVGVNAVAPPRTPPPSVPDHQRLTKGKAYDANHQSSIINQPSGSWPTYRGGMERFGYNPVNIQPPSAIRWTADIGDRLSPPVVAEGKVFVAAIDEYTVYAIDAGTGKPAWVFTAGGRVDSPPTIYDGRVYFGCADGQVYCLDADTGRTVWTFLAASARRTLMDKGRIESVWPLHGSVLIRDHKVYALAGRSMFLDGGLTLYILDSRTGDVQTKQVMDHRNPFTGEDAHRIIVTTDMATAKPDILSSDGKNIYMRSQALDMNGERLFFKVTDPGKAGNHDPAFTHLFCNSGFLGDPWFHRDAWIYGSGMKAASSCFTWPTAPSGKIMAIGPNRIFSYFRSPERWNGGPPVYDLLYAVDRSLPKPGASGHGFPEPKRGKLKVKFAAAWTVTPDIIINAMAVAGDTLCVAGPLDIADEGDYNTRGDLALYRRQEALLNGAEGSKLIVYQAADGAMIKELDVPSTPVFDGMAAAGGNLYIATKAGALLRIGADQ